MIAHMHSYEIVIVQIFQTTCSWLHTYFRWRRDNSLAYSRQCCDSTHIVDAISIAPLYIRITHCHSEKLWAACTPCIGTLKIVMFFYSRSTTVARAYQTSWPWQVLVSGHSLRTTPQIILTTAQTRIEQLKLIVLHFAEIQFPKNLLVHTSRCLRSPSPPWLVVAWSWGIPTAGAWIVLYWTTRWEDTSDVG